MGRAWDIERAAAVLLDAESSHTDRAPLSDDWPELDLRIAYAIQDEALQRRLRTGQQLVGIKLGLTSRAKQRRMNVNAPLTAWLTDAMVLPAGALVPQGTLIHPRAEPEIVFVMKDRLAGPGVTAATAMESVATVWSGIELIDSRYTEFRFTLPDVVADNASTGAFVTGPVGLAPHRLDLTTEACLVEVNGTVVESATGAAVLGHPAEALALAANELAARGRTIEPGWIVLTGGMADAVPVEPGTRVAAHFTNLGSIVISGG